MGSQPVFCPFFSIPQHSEMVFLEEIRKGFLSNTEGGSY